MEGVTKATGRRGLADLKGRILDFVSRRGEPSLEEVVEAIDDRHSVDAVRELVATRELSLAVAGYAWGVDFHVRLTR